MTTGKIQLVLIALLVSVCLSFTGLAEENADSSIKIYRFDTETVAFFEGVITQVTENHWYSKDNPNLTALFTTPDGSTYTLDLGMKELYGDMLPENNQSLIIKGSLVNDEAGLIILAERVQMENGIDVKVRTGKGVPSWQKSSSGNFRKKSFRYNLNRMRRKR